MSNQMPTQTFETMPPLPQHQPNAVPPKKKRGYLMPLLVVGALFLGLGAGAVTVPPKEVEVVKEVPVEKVVEKEVSVEVPTTPKACTDALDYAAIIFTMNADAIGTMTDMVKHAGTLDADGLRSDTAKLEDQTANLGKVKTPFADAAKECRASAG
ncbi:membrane protein [Arthrobacter phage Atuin]|nr:membrane protein [Arthrobacter phage Atuin]